MKKFEWPGPYIKKNKYRIWCIDSKKMIKWEDCHHYPMSMMFDNPDIYIPMQYTGKKDKNGAEVYEQDIVTYEDEDFRARREVIEMDEWWYGSDSLMSNKTEVIGNIYENPEILED